MSGCKIGDHCPVVFLVFDRYLELIKIKLNSVFVEDQDKALRFYTEVLGFVKKNLKFRAGNANG